jgi:outer membrane receptor for ferrienterochelin and colicins
MNKVLVLIFSSMFFVHNLHSQENKECHITGVINESVTFNPLEFSTITLINNKTKEVFGGISDKNGNFDVLAIAGIYTLKIEYISFKDKVFSKFNLDKNISLGTILLSINTESLEQVDISGKPQLTTFKLGKTVYNVQDDASSKGATATDILSNVPSITLNSKNEPIIRGIEAIVLINGRRSSMTKIEALQNLQASSIKRIEVMTMPSAKYGTGAEGGIINVILKKGLDNGLNGSVNLTGGNNNIYGGSTSINFRKNKINLYSNTSYFHRELLGEVTIGNNFFDDGIITGYSNEALENLREDKVFNSTFGVDYYLNDYANLNLEASYGHFVKGISTINTAMYNNANNYHYLTKEQLGFTDFANDIYEISFTYDQYFERESEQLYLNINFNNDLETNRTELFFNELFPSKIPLPSKDELIYNDIELNNFEWYAAYVFPLNENSTLEFGSRGEFGSIKTDFMNEIIFEGSFITNPKTSNNFIYTENHYGGYTEYSFQNEKYAFKAGLTIDQTDVTVELLTTNEISHQDYLNFLPSINMKFFQDENKSFGLSYRRDIGRTNYLDLNPFENRFSETTSFQGNPELAPVYMNSFELSYLNETEKKLTLKPSMYFKDLKDYWQYVTVETGETVNNAPKLLTTPINLGHVSFFGIELLINYTPYKWLKFNSTIDFRYANQKGIYEYTNTNNEIIILDYNNDNIGGSGKLKTNILLPFDIDFQTLIQYNLSSEAAYSKRYSYAYMNASLSKDILKDKATLTLNANDLFNSNQIERVRWTDEFMSLNKTQWRQPSVLLSFTYRFNESKKDKSLDINANDEQEKD